ncbi:MULTISPECIES: PTS sugar transporter subunit IIA [Lactobacillus]|uniref:PTS sugar transporter subunit IIA n=1 Tax=Lactobacillus TaxID=1578 RepID=UPI001C698ED8|nr:MULTISPECIES: PTS sugar transporter subunit IIA [Lactobacillus]MCX8720764.1 PTS sugar transporter subunit IIA [Lactobacillus sp. B4010]MCX8723567.1 PTS sugar transporter subunit IIA [Lactobacillus sp. B4005]MCX8731780.1 PTS sugar transporter subunit IIA [Lactobacillus sp. B4015]MCX8733946.1 PTS sugar transporter subunit IIA [Lactobacillus sp. B4012]QYN55897.1 PTS sugar transporter subunit IIA [Lactobacillus panisapium]
MVDITTVLDPQVITIGLDAKNKHDVIVKLARILKKANYIGDVNLFVKDIYLRENEGITGIGQGIAIPHGKSNDVKRIGVAIGILKHGIKWESLDDEKVKIVILFAVNKNADAARNQLKLLSVFAGKLGNEEVVAKLKKSKSVDDVIRAFAK